MSDEVGGNSRYCNTIPLTSQEEGGHKDDPIADNSYTIAADVLLIGVGNLHVQNLAYRDECMESLCCKFSELQ